MTTCIACAHFVINPKQMNMGLCTRFPPVVVGTMEGPVSFFPAVQGNQHCGEFKPKLVTSPQPVNAA